MPKCGNAFRCHLPCLTSRGNLGIDGVIHGPKSRIGVSSLQTKNVFGFSEGALFRKPQELLHPLMNQSCFGLIGCRIFIEKSCNGTGSLVEKKVICSGVSSAAAVVLKVIAGPNAGIGLVEWKLFFARTRSRIGEASTKQALLPLNMTIERRPYLARKFEVASPAQMSQQRVEEDEIHIVVIVRD